MAKNTTETNVISEQATTEENEYTGIYYDNIRLCDDVIFKNYSTTKEGGIIEESTFSFTGDGASATFGKDSSVLGDVDVHYELAADIYRRGRENNIIFEDSVI